MLLTNRGRGIAVVLSLRDYEEATEERAFMRGVVQGLMDLEEGREMGLADAVAAQAAQGAVHAADRQR